MLLIIGLVFAVSKIFNYSHIPCHPLDLMHSLRSGYDLLCLYYVSILIIELYTIEAYVVEISMSCEQVEFEHESHR